MNCFRSLVAGLALAALASANAAQAQTAAPCLSEEEVSGMVIYAMPSLLDAAQTTCSPQLTASGFMATGATRMAQKYAGSAQKSWPRAKSAFLKLGKLKSQDSAMFAQLPDEAVQPLVDALIVQMVSQEIKPGSCRNIERLVQVLDMLEPEQAGALSGVIAALALTGDKKTRICPATPS